MTEKANSLPDAAEEAPQLAAAMRREKDRLKMVTGNSRRRIPAAAKSRRPKNWQPLRGPL